MVTFKAVVLAHQRRGDDSFNVKIRITHKRKSKYIPTTITAYKSDLTKDLDIKRNSSLMFRCTREIESLTGIISDIGYLILENMTVDDVVEYITAKNKERVFHLDFFVFADEWIGCKSNSTRRTYVSALNTFSRYLGKREIDINAITSKTARDFVAWYSRQTKASGGRKRVSISTVKNAVRYLSTIHCAARDIHNDDDIGIIRIPRTPFKKIKFDLIVHEGQDSLTREEMQMMIDARVKRGGQVALDVFVLSFAMMGMNVADLFEAKVPKGEVLRYFRMKTRNRRVDRAEMRVLVPECVGERIERLSDGEDLISPEIKGTNHHYFSASLSHRMTVLSEDITGKQFSMYAARKTFATLARNECGVDKATVDECLVHITQDMKLADIYIKRDWTKLWEVQRKVLDLFEW